MRGALCGPGARPDNSSTVLEKAALSGCHRAAHPPSTWEGKGVPPVLLAGQNQGEDGGIKARDCCHPTPLCAAKADATLQGLGWLCVPRVLAGSELGPLFCYMLPGEPLAGLFCHADAS